MRKFIIISIFCLLIISAKTSLAQVYNNTIELTDGTKLKGMVTKLENGIFTVETENLGRIEVPQEKIVNITSSTDGRENAVDYNLAIPPQKFENAKNKLMNDPQVMSGVQELLEDKEVVKILSDPELVNAILSMDQESLQNNPKFQQLLSNPIMQKLIQQKAGAILQQGQ